jgi:tetratricopeptide (TPR) repeat protein
MAGIDLMLQEAIEAVRQGQRTRARDLLTRLLRADQSNPKYWLWMSAVVDSLKERTYCLQTVLRLEPGNEAARKGLVLIGAQPADQGINPVAPHRRKWQVQVQAEPPQGFARIWANPLLRGFFIAGVAIVVLGLVLAGIFGFNRRQVAAARPTKTPGPPPTFTSTPTLIGGPPVVVQITPSPTFSGPTPLWALLEATYTPTPLYVSTAHPITEAYRLGQRAYSRSDWRTALNYFMDASRVDPNAPDIFYYIGESQRMLGNYPAALEAYEQALGANANFAPAFLGRARTRLALDPAADIAEDLDRAVALDPAYGEAYLERAASLLARGETEAALADLEALTPLLPDAPLLHVFRARAALQTGDPALALQEAQLASSLDRTLLEAYLVTGQAAAASGDLPAALEALEIYLTYVPDDARGWLALGQAQAGITSVNEVLDALAQSPGGEQDEAALESFEHAADLDRNLPDLYLLRGLMYLRLDEGQKAVNDLLQARRLERDSFLINLGLGRALLAAGRLNEAYDQMSAGEELAQSDADLAALYYWRAQVADRQGRWPTALKDFEALLDLPEDAAPADWLAAAEEYIVALTPTPTPTVTRTPTRTTAPTSAPTATRTRIPTATP